MEKIQLTYSYNQSVANILLNDGKGNVLDNIMMNEILDCLNEIRQQNEIKLITFQGEGKHFSFGASVEEHTKELAPVMLQTFHKIFMTLVEMQVPTLAKISGQCLGGGMELALICNFLFADKSAKMGQPEIVLGVFPPPASIILPEKIGLARAEELLLTGRSMDAIEALETGLLNVVFEDKDALNAGTDAWIEKHIIPKSATSLRFAVRAARAKFNHIIGNFLPQLEYIYTRQLMETSDANEGIQSFLEKRQPLWTNT
ncbi:MAG: enoyl-CoA hydratase/isomerase family protein [Candidatus Competibacteraceae bacterium]|nr:enoyl-CoA hydratase/isomerase family protein [Candidatus Competibacteraceae bacterium]